MSEPSAEHDHPVAPPAGGDRRRSRQLHALTTASLDVRLFLGGLAARPQQYEERVISFFDRALRESVREPG